MDESLFVESGLAPEVLDKLESAAGSPVGPTADALVFFSRWWELETWLRQLVYVELRAEQGLRWSEPVLTHLKRKKRGPATDDINSYMKSPDSESLLAYLDSWDLFDLIASEPVWRLVQPPLLDLDRWRVGADTVRHLRNRNTHCRRPHADDVDRLEQFLRDLEAGARVACTAFNQTSRVPDDLDDPVAEGWVRGSHQTADRLLKHADRQYQISFELSYSRRPWADDLDEGPISGKPGYLWHATWFLREDRYLAPRKFWNDGYLAPARDLLVFSLHPFWAHVEVAIPAVDEPDMVNDAIGACFDAVISASHRLGGRDPGDAWRDTSDLDWRVQVGSLWENLTSDVPFTAFQAQKSR